MELPQHQVRKHDTAVGVSARTERRFAYLDLKFAPHTMIVVLELLPLVSHSREILARSLSSEKAAEWSAVCADGMMTTYFPENNTHHQLIRPPYTVVLRKPFEPNLKNSV